ncbi:MAG: lipoyl(octanoyl) transferase LipB, partial [Rhodothermales bacterium]|nr:lipoyl(octanoyl) transferase LipB [Rhodothermales bacterium]
DYRKTWELQKSIQRRLVEEKRNNPRHQVPHVLLTVEHPPVYTLGKSGDDSNLLINDHDLSALGASFVHIDRGGDITFHGPGQLVAYPILDLGHFYTDIHRYLRELEQVVILTCAAFGLATGRVHGLTGVWTRSTESLASRKICSMGIKCSRWVTSHGLALNVHTDLSYFSKIVPCGIQGAAMTSLARETGSSLTVGEVLPRFVESFADVFGVTTEQYGVDESQSVLSSYVSERVKS